MQDSHLPAEQTPVHFPAHFPVFLDLRCKRVLVIGAGAVAKRKIQALLEAGADVQVVSLTLEPEIAQWCEAKRVHWLATQFEACQLTNVWLVIAATDDEALNARVAAAANAAQRWVNVVDRSELCAFQVPARIERGALQIAISTGGHAPMLARHLREKLETELDESYSLLAQLFAEVRPQIRAELSVAERRQFFDAALHGEVAALARAGMRAAAKHQLLQEFQHFAQQKTAPEEVKLGRVALVGAGPGDAGLLTLRALRMLNLADVILSDQLVSAEVLALARRDAEIEFVGKRGGAHCTPQEDIHERMLHHAREGKFVVRLKGGDPFVFGRGGEELEFLREHGVAYEVVPGITAAVACAAYSGVPLTHREHAQSVRLVTAHCKNSLDTLDWQALAQERQTLAIYMGVSGLEPLRDNLLHHGRTGETPFVLVENGSRKTQRILRGTLAELPELARAHGAKAPSLLILGEVAALSEKLHWFGDAAGTTDAMLNAIARERSRGIEATRSDFAGRALATHAA